MQKCLTAVGKLNTRVIQLIFNDHLDYWTKYHFAFKCLCHVTLTGYVVLNIKVFYVKISHTVKECLRPVSVAQWFRPLVMGYSVCWEWLAGSLQRPESILSGAMVSFQLHPARRWSQLLPSPVVIFLAASDASDIHGCPLSVTVHFQGLEATSGTVCHPMSPELQCILFFGTASILTFFLDHFLYNCFLHLHCVPKKRPSSYFSNNFLKN